MAAAADALRADEAAAGALAGAATGFPATGVLADANGAAVEAATAGEAVVALDAIAALAGVPLAVSGNGAAAGGVGGGKGFSNCTLSALSGTALLMTGTAAALATGTIKAGSGGSVCCIGSSLSPMGVVRTTVFR